MEEEERDRNDPGDESLKRWVEEWEETWEERLDVLWNYRPVVRPYEWPAFGRIEEVASIEEMDGRGKECREEETEENAQLELDIVEVNPEGGLRRGIYEILVRVFGVSLFVLSCFFVGYIFYHFLLRNPADWHTISDYSATTIGAVCICIHWVGGVFVTLLGFVNLPLSSRKVLPPVLHAAVGRLYVFCACITSLAGLSYVLLIGTVGGLPMDVSFSIYGVLLAVSSIMAAMYAARREFKNHRSWARRAFILGVGSAIYRLLTVPIQFEVVHEALTEEQIILWLNIGAWVFYPLPLALTELLALATGNE